MRSPEKLYCFGVEVRYSPLPGDELFAALGFDFSSYEDLENHTFRHTVYAADETERAQKCAAFERAAAVWKRDLGVELGETQFFVLDREDWSEAWKKYFHPIEISERLLVCPSWLDAARRPGQKILTIDPGMSFGTGQHATTLYCLQCIDRLAATEKITSMLDAGCGSGILSIAGALSGIENVDAFDLDPDAVRIARENLAINKISGVFPEVGDAAVYPGRTEKYDLVCANILGHLLVKFRYNIARWVGDGKHLVLAGILEREFDEVSAAFRELGFVETERNTLREWTGGYFRKTGK
ncbi:MAG: 50S ribosomal protein L11 methyltransferase [Victivallaceae bacterium]|nr:50S ribosomal protein L11 methyltransferase [Victivallaceae bacterium]